MKRFLIACLLVVCSVTAAVALFDAPAVAAQPSPSMVAAAAMADAPPWTLDCPCADAVVAAPFCGTCETTEKEAPYDCLFDCSYQRELDINAACQSCHDCLVEAKQEFRQTCANINAAYEYCKSHGGVPSVCAALRDAALDQAMTDYTAATQACVTDCCETIAAANDVWFGCMQSCCLACITPDPTMPE
jgi:hypothetical protein